MAIDEGTFIIGCTWPEHEDEQVQYTARVQYAARILLGARTPIASYCVPARPEVMADFQARHPEAYETLLAQAVHDLGRLGINPPAVNDASETEHTPTVVRTLVEQTARQSIAA